MTGSFNVGTTILHLEVTDNTGDKAVASTFVSLRAPQEWEKNVPFTTSTSPGSGPTYGGFPVAINGFGMYNYPRVYFGSSEAKVLSIDSNKQITVSAPAGSGSVPVTVSNGFGDGTTIATFDYFESELSQVKFSEDVVRNPDGSQFAIDEVTAITLGPDGLYYACSLDGFVHVLEIDASLTVVQHCKSPQMGQNRAALGIAFNPRDTEMPPKIYVSTSSLFWKNKNTANSWDNGKIEVWQKGGGCMEYKYDAVSGLPVSNHDHGVNAIQFLNNGDMLVAIGGSTNAGIHTNDDGIGGIPESPLSAAIIRFPLSKGDKFNGKIEYDQTDNPLTANIVSGDVDVYASGIRNAFGFIPHSSGAFYAMTNGANADFGLASKDCQTLGGSVSEQDGLLNLKEGSYYGHPNRNRGRYDERQCTYVGAKDANLPADYTRPLQLFGSSTNGMAEYTANTFDFQLRGNLFLSKLSWSGPGKVHRVVLSEDGNGIAMRSVFWEDGGLAMVMSPFGDLLMPKVKQAKIMALRPEYTPREKVHVRAVSPRRGLASGGYSVMVSGSGFKEGMSLSFGGTECSELSRFASDGSSVWCAVPASEAGSKVVVVATVGSDSSPQHDHADFEYI